MAKTLILIHGRNWKPKKNELKALWLDALDSGFERDYAGTATQTKWKNCKKEFVYYGDISNAHLKSLGKKRRLSEAQDLKDRKDSLKALKLWNAGDFNRRNYKKLPGSGALKEGVADILAPLLKGVGLSDNVIKSVAPDMHGYWQGEESEFGSNVREPLISPLKKAMDRNDSICVVSHSLGTMIAYDTFWKFNYTGEYRADGYHKKKIDLFVTTGSPLSDGTIQDRLKGAKAKGSRRYPANLKKWVNIAAEDDFISHDKKLSNDYQYMTRKKMIQSITDIGIYNLALRRREPLDIPKSNQHHGAGYLIHPKTIETLATWL